MSDNPFATLARSRKFWLAILDAVVSTILLLATRYLSPADTEFVKQIVVIYQPVVLALIASMTWQNVEHAKADASIVEAQIEADAWAQREPFKPVEPAATGNP